MTAAKQEKSNENLYNYSNSVKCALAHSARRAVAKIERRTSAIQLIRTRRDEFRVCTMDNFRARLNGRVDSGCGCAMEFSECLSGDEHVSDAMATADDTRIFREK